jgi:hypothetical protein
MRFKIVFGFGLNSLENAFSLFLREFIREGTKLNINKKKQLSKLSQFYELFKVALVFRFYHNTSLNSTLDCIIHYYVIKK